MELPDDVAAVSDVFLTAADVASPGLVDGLFLHGSLCWGEFFHDSDIDFLATLVRAPETSDLAALASVHTAVREAFPDRRFEGLYRRADDLAASPDDLRPMPVHFAGAFDPAAPMGNPVTWHELAERGIVVRGVLPPVHTDLEALLDYSHANLAGYWGDTLARIEASDPAAVGADDWTVCWVALGVARLHHLLALRRLTSKSGAGRYTLEHLDPRWHRLAEEALAIRERPGSASSYDDPAARGRDLHDFAAWVVADGARLR